MQQDDEHVEQTEGRRRHNEEVDRGEIGDVVLKEGSPSLRRRLRATRHETGNSPLRDVEPELEQLAVDARRAPEDWRAPWCERVPQAPIRCAVDPFARAGTSRSRTNGSPFDASESPSRGERCGAPRATLPNAERARPRRRDPATRTVVASTGGGAGRVAV